jgi:glycosyltransferase involved in cell wall biosynthesis
VSRLSVAIVALNEEERIRACLESVAWADDIVVVDSGSSDKTVAIAREFTDRVLFHPWSGYGPQKNYAVDRCESDWVLSLDADERVSDGLREEIRSVLRDDPPLAGFLLPRENYFQGRLIRHGGWYPDYQLRLFRRGRGRFTDVPLHESIRLDGPRARLRQPLRHESYRGVTDFVTRAQRYAELAARTLAAEGRGGSAVDLLLRPLARFTVMYVVRLGFLDGWRGLVLAALYAQYVFVRAARVRELRDAPATGRVSAGGTVGSAPVGGSGGGAAVAPPQDG